MIRIIAIALVILGLVAQPLMAAIVDSVPPIESSSPVSADNSQLDISTSDHDATGGDEASAPPCHEMAAEDSGSVPCTDCDGHCANAACASACAPSSVAIIDHSSLKLERLSVFCAVGKSVALVQGLPPRIFHPPKHA